MLVLVHDVPSSATFFLSSRRGTPCVNGHQPSVPGVSAYGKFDCSWCDCFSRNLPTNHKSCTTRFLELIDGVTLRVHQAFDSLRSSRFPVDFKLFDHTTPFVAVDSKQLKICELGTSLLALFLRRTHVVRYRASFCFLRVRSLISSFDHGLSLIKCRRRIRCPIKLVEWSDMF